MPENKPRTIKISDLIGSGAQIKDVQSKPSNTGRISIADFVEKTRPEKPRVGGFGEGLKSFARAVVTPPATIAARPFQLGKALLGADKEQQAVTLPFVGKIPTVGSTKDVKKDIGRGIETISFGLGGGVAKQGVQNVLRGAGKETFKQGVKESTKIGAIGGFGAGLGETGEAKGAVLGTAVGAGFGAGVGVGFPVAKSVISKTKPIVSRLSGKKAGQDEARKIIETTFRDIAGKYQVAGRKLSVMESKKGTKPIETISSYGDSIPRMINDSMENGKINPAESIEFLRNKIANLSGIKSDVVKVSDEAIPFAEYQKRLNSMINKQSWSKAKKDAAKKQTTKLLDGIGQSYDNGVIPLTEIDTIKTEQTALSKSYNNPGKNPFEYDAHGILGKLSREIVEDTTKDAPTKELNKIIQSHYDAIELLEALRGKTPKGGVITKLATQMGGQTVGALAGLPTGDPLIGAIVGRVGADVAFDILGNNLISNPVKRMMIKNLQEADNVVIKNALKYIDDVLEAKSKRLRLPSPKGNVINKGRPIPVLPKGSREFIGEGISVGDFIPPQRSVPKNQLNAAKPKVQANIANTNDIPTSNTKLPKKSSEAGFISLTPFKNDTELTTKLLKKLEGKTTVSKQYISDLTNSGDLKQVERELFRDLLSKEGDKINVAEFAAKVRGELLPLKTVKAQRYENISLGSDLRGDVKNYTENIYESPIKTSAGKVHFSGTKKFGEDPENYFGHTRIEDMADDQTRRVIEVQSDLYQKGRLDAEDFGRGTGEGVGDIINKDYGGDITKFADTEGLPADMVKSIQSDVKNYQKLQQYNNPTAHFRMVREEIKKASQDGKTKLQFPTGETAMKIEGLGQGGDRFSVKIGNEWTELDKVSMNVGMEITGQDGQWIITDVLGDGKFRAIPRDAIGGMEDQLSYLGSSPDDAIEALSKGDKQVRDILEGSNLTESFDISEKVDTSNPIYRFYEKDLQKYLKKFNGKQVTDENGVNWIEVPITDEYANNPVEAFGRIGINPLTVGAGVTGLAAFGSAVITKDK